MTSLCDQYERALLAEDVATLSELAGHGDGCETCRPKKELWTRVDAVAPSLKASWPTEGLAPRIAAALASGAPSRRRMRWWPLGVAAALAVYALAAWLSLRERVLPEAGFGLPDLPRERLLSDASLEDVRKKESAYVTSIEALERRAGPRLKGATSPLLAGLREKLLLLDGAIADCRREIEKNEFNTNLRRELLAMYQEKRKTLQELLNEKKENGDKS